MHTALLLYVGRSFWGQTGPCKVIIAVLSDLRILVNVFAVRYCHLLFSRVIYVTYCASILFSVFSMLIVLIRLSVGLLVKKRLFRQKAG